MYWGREMGEEGKWKGKNEETTMHDNGKMKSKREEGNNQGGDGQNS
jgi:hypothetical protein